MKPSTTPEPSVPAGELPSPTLPNRGLVTIGSGQARRRRDVVCRLGGMEWDRQSFCRGWFISGATGSGKTLSGLRQILYQTFEHQPNFGGLCIDDKGTLHDTLLEMARHFGREKDVILLQVRPESAPTGWQPEHRFNLVGDPSIPFATYARCLVDTASSLGNRREQGFFRSAAQIHIGAALAALAALDYEVTLDNAAELLTDPAQLRTVTDELENSGRTCELAQHFQQYITQPVEQLGGITGTIRNYLHHFTAPEIAEVFSRDSTFRLDEVDQGKILCLALPQKFQTERRYVGSLLKQLFFIHALRRFDGTQREREEKNLLLFLADEAQHFLSASEDGQSDHNVVDVLREAGVAFIAATQSSTSLVPVLGAENAKVLLLNLRNRILFTAADEDDARVSADFLGKKPVWEISETSGEGRRTRTRTQRERYRIEPHQIRNLRKHQCILVHAEKGFRRCYLPPIQADGRKYPWYRPWWWFW